MFSAVNIVKLCVLSCDYYSFILGGIRKWESRTSRNGEGRRGTGASPSGPECPAGCLERKIQSLIPLSLQSSEMFCEQLAF